uniref:Uncharacterized protein n=1 Tax=Amphimedon queenslandica TaxID=400682 RepID=A0A1X7SZA7_AMPQE
MSFSKKCCALFLSCLLLAVQAKTDFHDGKRKSADDDLFYNIIEAIPVEAGAARAQLVSTGLGLTSNGLAEKYMFIFMISAIVAPVATLQSIVGWLTVKENPPLSNINAGNNSIERGVIISLDPQPQIDNF